MSNHSDRSSPADGSSDTRYLAGWLQFCGGLIVFVGFVLLFSLWPDERAIRMLGSRVIIPALLSPVIGIIMGSVFFGLAAAIQDIRKIQVLLESRTPSSALAPSEADADTSADKQESSAFGTSGYVTPTAAAVSTIGASANQKSATSEQINRAGEKERDTPPGKPYDVVFGVAIFQNADGSFSVSGKSFDNVVEAYSAARKRDQSTRFGT